MNENNRIPAYDETSYADLVMIAYMVLVGKSYYYSHTIHQAISNCFADGHDPEFAAVVVREQIMAN